MKRIRYLLAITCTVLCLMIPVYTIGKNSTTSYEEDQQVVQEQSDEEEQSVEIQEEEVPLGLDSMASYERYKRDVAVLLVFISMVVTITVGANIKEKSDREKLN